MDRLSEAVGAARARIAAGAAFVVVATIVAYLPSIRAGFIWDDDQHVTDNTLLRSARGLKLIWTALGATPQYYPLTHTSFWIEYHLWGSSPTGYHVINVALHAGSALLLWRILRLLRVPGAWLATCLFALHPIEVESVAWITERKNVLSGVFYSGAMLAYLTGTRGDSRPRPGWYLCSLVLFACALLSKTLTGTLPGAILLILWWKDGRLPWKHGLHLAPMIVAAFAAGSITSWMERTQVGAAGPDWDFSILERTLIAGRALWFYAYKIVVPYQFTFVYPRWEVDPHVVWQ